MLSACPITQSPCHNRCFQNFCCLGYAFLDYGWWRLADAPDPSLSPVAGQQPRRLGGSSHSTATPRSPAPPSCHPPKTGCRGRTGKVRILHGRGALPSLSQHPLGDDWFEDRKGYIYLKAYVCNNGTKLQKARREHACMVILDSKTLLYSV